ncbi:MAG: hypothetical protein HYX56_05025 [Chloroflexi bacterium]|nr:hypothetical protein [Chloroflexota bacterium]
MRSVRPDPLLLWPAYTLFPLAGLLILFFAAAGRGDPALTVIGIALLALNGAIVVNHLYFTSLGIEGNDLVHRSWLVREQRVGLGSLQRVDAKRYAGAHGGVSAPNLVARGRDAVVRVNTKPYRLHDIASLIGEVRAINPRVEIDDFWTQVQRGEVVSKETAVTPRGRF